MNNTEFANLISLVLVDILASLPMEHVVRMARLGHERLRKACSLKWVNDRMTDVTFGTIVRAHLIGGDVAAVFCAKTLMKRLMGRITIVDYDCNNEQHLAAYIAVAKQVPGKLCFNLSNATCSNGGDCSRCDQFFAVMTKQVNLTYYSVTAEEFFVSHSMDQSPTLVFQYSFDTDFEDHDVYYRPALLNGRHIVDVLRAVCGPGDVDEAELDSVRSDAAEGAEAVPWRGEGWQGVWHTTWEGAAVIAEVEEDAVTAEVEEDIEEITVRGPNQVFYLYV